MDIELILISGLCITLLFCLMNLPRYDYSIKNMYIDNLDRDIIVPHIRRYPNSWAYPIRRHCRNHTHKHRHRRYIH